MDYHRFVHEMCGIHRLAKKALCEIPADHESARTTVMEIKHQVEALDIFPKDILSEPYNPPCGGGITVEG